MIPGPIYVYKCPNCSNLLTKESLTSGNTIGAKIYSDGKRIAQDLPEFPNLTKCKKCETVFWLSKMKEIGRYEWEDDNVKTEWESADEAEFLEIEDYFNAINNGTAKNNIDELFIRKQIWWAYNDKLRQGEKIFSDINDELLWLENINKLITLLDHTDINQRIAIAEINRNLGDFENCKRLLESIKNDDLNWIKEKLLNECKRMNKWLIILN